MTAAPPSILVTGGAGYIGSHTCVTLLEAGYRVVVYDNFCNSQPAAIARVRRIASGEIVVVNGDVRDQALLERTLREQDCQSVIHFAGLKAVGESVARPLDYYDTNVIGSHRLLRAMQATGVRTLVFSSSATVYGDPVCLPYTETHPLAPTNPYGRTKLMVEDMLRDLHRSDDSWRVAILRYFNPVGAHPSGLIGEDPQGIPNNLMPFIAQVAVGRRAELNVWGNDYPTPDGTGVRDYIHVMDLAEGHLCALRRLAEPGCLTVNLGTGRGYSVLDMVRAFERASGRTIPLHFAARRPGDLAEYYADPAQAEALLGWRASRDIDAICGDHWGWQHANPDGYRG
ncbi:UDP-glucose 4-epimerase GalE [Methyloparacoccus murrellii]